MLENVLSILNQNYIALVAIIIPLSVAYYFYKKSLIIPKPVYCDRRILLIDKTLRLPPAITINYQGQLVEELSKYRMIFWNAGRGTLYGKDIVPSAPISINFHESVKILTAEILKTTTNSNEVSIKIDPNSANRLLMIFDYLNENDGVSIEILLNGETQYPFIYGEIRRVSQGILDWGIIPRLKLETKEVPIFLRFLSSKFPHLRNLRVLLLIFSLILLLMGLSLLLPPYDVPIWTFILSIILAIVCFIMFIMGMYILLITTRKIPKSLNFDDEI